MAIQLTAKESMLLKDQKSAEELCVKKYQTYANQAQDPQLKQLFSSLAQKEQEHLNTINQILNGQVPKCPAGTIRTTANSNWTTNAAKETCNAKSPSKGK